MVAISRFYSCTDGVGRPGVMASGIYQGRCRTGGCKSRHVNTFMKPMLHHITRRSLELRDPGGKVHEQGCIDASCLRPQDFIEIVPQPCRNVDSPVLQRHSSPSRLLLCYNAHRERAVVQHIHSRLQNGSHHPPAGMAAAGRFLSGVCDHKLHRDRRGSPTRKP